MARGYSEQAARDLRADLLRRAKRTVWDLTGEFNRCGVEAAVYWYANDYHQGMGDPLYAVLCLSPYSPGCMEDGPRAEGGALDAYEDLVASQGIE